MSDLKRIGADGIFRGQSQRHYDFRTGIRLGKNDHITKWKRPAKPEWMTDEQHSTYPKEIEIREFKVDGNVYVTTFLNSKRYHKKELAWIYKRRWDVGVSSKGHCIQSVKVRPKLKDSNFVAWKALWRESKMVTPFDNMFRKEHAQYIRL